MNISNLDVTKFNLLNTEKIVYKYLRFGEFTKYFDTSILESQLIDPSNDISTLSEYKSITVNGEPLIDDNYLYHIDLLDKALNPSDAGYVNPSTANDFASLNSIDDRFKLSSECVVFDAEYKGIPIINTLSVKNEYNITKSRCLYLKLDNITLFKFFLLPGVKEISFLTKNNELAGQLICYSEDESSDNNSMREYLNKYASNLSRLLGINNISNLKETDFFRTVTVDISGYASSNNVQLLVHKKLPFCHESITAYELYDFVKNYRITPKLMIDNIFRTNRQALINGSLICDDFTKFYAGSPTSYNETKNFRFTLDSNTVNSSFVVKRYDKEINSEVTVGTFTKTDIGKPVWNSDSLSKKLSYGDRITVTPSGTNSHIFTHWNDGRVNNPLVVNIDSDIDVVGYFKIDKYNVSIVVKYKKHQLIDDTNNMSDNVKNYYKEHPIPGNVKFENSYDIKDSKTIYNWNLFNYKLLDKGQNSIINILATTGYKIDSLYEVSGYNPSRSSSNSDYDILGKYTGSNILSTLGNSGSKLSGNIYDLKITDNNISAHHKYIVVFTEDAFKVNYWKNDPEYIKLDTDS